jgi:hypothetical protein
MELIQETWRRDRRREWFSQREEGTMAINLKVNDGSKPA